MEMIINSSLKQEVKQNPTSSPINSPKSSTSSYNNGVAAAATPTIKLPVLQLHHNKNNLVPPLSTHHHHHQKPIITTRSEPLTSTNPYPTTFVQADSSSFKQVVQMLTGSTETTTAAPKPDSQQKNPIPPRRQQGFKLYERRNSGKSFKISPVLPGFKTQSSPGFSPRNPNSNPEILSPSILDFPSLVLSPVTPLVTDPFNRSPHHHQQLQLYHQQQQQQQQNGYCRNNNNGGSDSIAEEDKAIAEKGFYFHKSPATTPRDSEPRLLPLFPVTSPRVSGSSS